MNSLSTTEETGAEGIGAEGIGAEDTGHQCYTMLDVGDNFCRQCGAATGNVPTGGRAAPGSAAYRSETKPGWSESPWIVLSSLFLFVGPLALPMLWRSRRFSTTWKIALSVLVAALTVLVIWLMWYVIAKAVQPLSELRELRGF